MSETENSTCSSLEEENNKVWTPSIPISECDRRFFQCLYEFIEEEKEFLQCPEEGPDEQRHSIYSSVFNKVIGRATAYKSLLSAIKTEYDDVIRALRRRRREEEEEARAARRSLTHTVAMTTCQSRAARLKDRISSLQRETEIQEKLKVQERERTERNTVTLIPGLTAADWTDPEVLSGCLERLQDQRAALLDRRRNCVSLQVGDELRDEVRDEPRDEWRDELWDEPRDEWRDELWDEVRDELRDAEEQRDRLRTENHRLFLLNRRLCSVSSCLSSWQEEQQVPLEKFLGSTLENLGRSDVTDPERCGDSELFEDDEPTKVNESKLLLDHLERFLQVFEAAQYEEAALLAARSPRGVLRNTETMEMFKAVRRYPGPVPPLLRFFQALLVSVPDGGRLSAALSLQAVRCAVQQGSTQLLTHAVTHHRLTFSEALGDVLTERAQNDPGSADALLASATAVYRACGLERKTALSMCRRGLIHGAAEFLSHCQDLTAEDCLWVLSLCPSLPLLQLLTEPQCGRAAILSVGGACCALLQAGQQQQQQQLGLQLLDVLQSRGTGVLERAILRDAGCSAEVWARVASLCAGLDRADLSRDVLSVLLAQTGTCSLCPDPEGARLMEHVFL